MRKILLLLALLLIGCEPPLMSGFIHSKEWVPAHDEVKNDIIQIGDIIIPVSNTIHVPDRYYITIRREEENGELRHRSIEVPKDQYEELKLGVWYSLE